MCCILGQTLLDYLDHVATLRELAAEHHLQWPERQEDGWSSDILDRAAQLYAGRLTRIQILLSPTSAQGISRFFTAFPTLFAGGGH